MKHNDITILILLYKTPKKLIKNILNYKDFKILILDQSNDLKTKKYLKKRLPKIAYYGLTKINNGFAKAQNFLIKKVQTKYFFSSQADIQITKNSIIKLKKIIEKNNNNLIAIPNINNSISYKNRKKTTSKKMIGAAFMSKKKDFIKIGMFDDNFFYYWEDVDLSNRINNSSYRIVQNFYSKAIHSSGNSTYKGINQTYIRKVNFRFGEYLYLNKNKKLRKLKIFREITLNVIRILLNLITLKFNKSLLNIFNLVGIFKFLIFKK